MLTTAILVTIATATSVVGGGAVDQVIAREFEAVTLTCDYSRTRSKQRNHQPQDSVIRWSRNNTTILSAENVGVLVLDIPRVSRYDAGLFKCEFLRHGNVKWQFEKRLIVAYAPSGVPILLPESLSGHNFVPEGASVSLACHLVGDPGWPPAVPVWSWRRGSEDTGDCCTGKQEMVIKPKYRRTGGRSKRTTGKYWESNPEDVSGDDDFSGESWSCFYKNELGATRMSVPRRIVVQPAVTVANYSWTKPTDQTAVEGETVTFTCNVSNPAVVVTWNIRSANEGAADMNMLLTGGNGVTLRSHELSPRITSAGHLNLVISNVTREDEAVYICKVGSHPWAEAKLTVLVRPSKAKLTRISPESTTNGNSVRAGQRVTFNCSSHGGNPSPKLEWSRSNGIEFDVDAQVNTETNPFGTTWSTMSFHARPDDDNTDVVCTVSHQLLATPHRSIKTLRIEYAPVLTVSPPERLRARLGTTANVHCLARANPSVDSLTWLRPGGPMGIGERTLSRDGAYQFRVERSDSGTMICRARNAVGEREQAIGVEVLYPPELSVTKGPISVLEGSSAVLRCEAVASPTPSVLRWRRTDNGAVLAEVAESSALVHAVEPISRHDAGIYSCEAKNLMIYQAAPGISTKVESEEGSDAKQVEIVVLYPPGKAVIKNGAVVTVAAGESVRLFCEVEDLGNPAGTVSWYRLPEGARSDSPHARAAVGRSSGTTAELRMENVNAERVAGLYECLAENKFGRGVSAIVTLVVNEQPRWVNPLVHSQKPLWKAQDFTLSCTAAGNPAPLVSWLKNGHPLTDGTSGISNSIQLPMTYSIQTSQPVLKRGLHHVQSVLQFPRNGLSRNDSGLYACKAENKLGVSSSQTTVTVLYPPVPITTFSKFSANLGRSARLRFLVHSASKPRFYWSIGGSRISNSSLSGHYHIIERDIANREVFESVLVIGRVTKTDFGLYTIRAENDQGRTSDTVLRLVEPGVPDPPTVLEAKAMNWDAAKLLWKPGFDGGSPQSVEILLYNDQPANFDNAKMTPIKSLNVQIKPSSAKILGLIGLAEDGSNLDYVIDGTAETVNNIININEINITGLLPGSGYLVRLRGVNQYGVGQLTNDIVRFVTPNLTEPTDVFFNPIARAIRFHPVDARLCVKVAKTLDGGRTWYWFGDCLNAGRGVVSLGSWPDGALAIALQMCLDEKPKPTVCTGLVSARARHFDPDDVNNGWSPFDAADAEGISNAFLSTPALILGVAAGIGATLILLLVSIVIVCKKRKATPQANNPKDGMYSLCGRGSAGASTGSSGGMDDASSKPVLLSAGSGGCYAAIDSVVTGQQHSGSGSSAVSGSSPLDMSELLPPGQYQSSATMLGAFSSIPQQSFLPQHMNQQTANCWSQSSTASGSTESAMLHVEEAGVAVGEDLTAMLRRICAVQQQQIQHQNDNNSIPSDHLSSASNNAPLLSSTQLIGGYNQQQLSANQTPDPTGQQRRVRYEVVV